MRPHLSVPRATVWNTVIACPRSLFLATTNAHIMPCWLRTTAIALVLAPLLHVEPVWSLDLKRPDSRTSRPAADGDWLGRVQRQLAEREYEASRNAEGLQAPNRAHNLRTYFEPSGIRVVDRTAEESPARTWAGVWRGRET